MTGVNVARATIEAAIPTGCDAKRLKLGLCAQPTFGGLRRITNVRARGDGLLPSIVRNDQACLSANSSPFSYLEHLIIAV